MLSLRALGTPWNIAVSYSSFVDGIGWGRGGVEYEKLGGRDDS